MNPVELAELQSLLSELTDAEVRRRHQRPQVDIAEAAHYAAEIERRNLDV